MKLNENKYLKSIEQLPILIYVLKWIIISSVIAFLVGTASAGFIELLNYVTNIRESKIWIISLLPLAGLLIGLFYHYWGGDVVKGNNQILEEYYQPRKVIPFKMAPFVFAGTILTHLFGGSAGREGTAVQMGGAIADQFTRLFKLKNRDRRIILIIGISSGFASVFGTPLAGAVFALEVLAVGKVRYDTIYPSFFAAIIGSYACHLWGVKHTEYIINIIPDISIINILWGVLAGLIFGIAAFLFSKLSHFWAFLFKTKIKYAPLRPFMGGVVIAIAVYLLGTTKYIGLGIPTIQQSFLENVDGYDFILKILFTTFTLGAGFKGGEVTPLFFVGATLGNSLAWFVPLPMALLTGMGFVAVFAGATNTPIACILMGIELFGIEARVFIAIACITAYMFSGHTSIYGSQIIGNPKHLLFSKLKGKNLY